MFNQIRAERHIAKSDELHQCADEVFEEAVRFGFAGEVDEDGQAPGDNVEAQRCMDLFYKLTTRAQNHAQKAIHLLDGHPYK